MSSLLSKSVLGVHYGVIREASVPEYGYRWQGHVTVDVRGLGEINLLMMGNIAQWLIEGEKVKLVIKEIPKRFFNKHILYYDDYELYRIWGDEHIKVWPIYRRKFVLPRYDSVTGKELYRYEVIAREALSEEDYRNIVNLEQYHYASQKIVVAVWRCPKCGKFFQSNTPPICPTCNIEAKLVEIKGSLPSSRFLVLELAKREPYEPRIVGYVRVDTPIPLMSRKVVDEKGTVIIEKFIRERVFGKSWFHPTFWPEAYTKRRELMKKYRELVSIYGKRIAKAMIGDELRKELLKAANTAVSRIARVVIHPDYRGDGLGVLAVRAAIDWIRERRVPEMKRRKHLVETIAQMARYNPFFEKAGFIFLWETASGRPVLYYPLTEIAREKIAKFLKEDPYAKKHGGKLYRSRYGKVEVIAEPIVLSDVTKTYRNLLDISRLSEKLQDVLRAFGVEKRIIEKTVLHHVNLTIKPKEIVAVVGVSGAGKTTLLRMIAGAALKLTDKRYIPSRGEINVPKNIKLSILLPGELEPTFGDESILEHIYDKTGDEFVSVEILNMCGLSDAVFYRAKFSELSTGQKERAKLASLLAEKPNVLIIDEFTAHLDALTARRVARKLSEIARKAGITVIVATNRSEVLDALVPDKIVYVGYGSVKVIEKKQ